ncbi:MAG: hypothetical protein PHG11_07925 [Eubacteriales bacterium]|nr:hypothetical protein [Eubacteriales bacterium]
MRVGKCLAQGTKAEVLQPKHLNKAYGMDVGAWMRTLALPWAGYENGQNGNNQV